MNPTGYRDRNGSDVCEGDTVKRFRFGRYLGTSIIVKDKEGAWCVETGEYKRHILLEFFCGGGDLSLSCELK